MKNKNLSDFCKSLISGALVSGISFFIESNDKYGWPLRYYINDRGGCHGPICEMPLEKFFPINLLLNTLIWVLIFGVFFIVMRKLKKS